jgi:hypothetical protein
LHQSPLLFNNSHYLCGALVKFFTRPCFCIVTLLYTMILGHAICSVAVLPLRVEPSHKVEQCSQLLFGERMEVWSKDKNGWLFVRSDWDNTEGYVQEGQVTHIPLKEYRKPLLFLSTGLQSMLLFEQGQQLLSPGSSLFRMKKHVMAWHDNTALYKGKKIALKQIDHQLDTVQQLCYMFCGSPYLWGGRSVWGIDASGFVQLVYKLLDIRLPRYAAEQSTCGETVDFLQAAQCGDLAFFDNEEGTIHHVGILLNSNTIIHATDTTGTVNIDPIDNGGIVSKKLRMRTYKLRLVKRILKR